jgi:hypothetical protein
MLYSGKGADEGCGKEGTAGAVGRENSAGKNSRSPPYKYRSLPHSGINPEVRGIMPPSERSPLARLVLFMVCLSVAGGAIAAVHYYAIDLPQQKALPAPENTSWQCRTVVGLPNMYVLVNTGEWTCEELKVDSGHRTFRCCLRNFV